MFNLWQNLSNEMAWERILKPKARTVPHIATHNTSGCGHTGTNSVRASVYERKQFFRYYSCHVQFAVSTFDLDSETDTQDRGNKMGLMYS